MARRKDPRPLHLKIRVSARRGMIQTQEDLTDLLEHIVTTHQVPDGVTVHWIDWKKGTGGRANSGRIEDNLADELAAFWFAIAHADSEVEAKKVEPARRKGRARARGRPKASKSRRRPRA